MRVSGQDSAKRDKNILRSTRRGGGDGPYREYVSIKGVKVNEEVNASISQGGHAVGVVLGGINMVDPDRVDTEILHQRRIASTLLRVDQGIVRSELVGNTLEEEFCFDMVSRSISAAAGSDGTLRVPFS